MPLVGRRTRAAFAAALQGPISSAVSGAIAGLVTQSPGAVSWIIIGFVRTGAVMPGPALLAPAWANVGSAMLPLLVAINTATAASFVIGFVGFVTYFKLVRSDRVRNILDAALGAALLLFGMQVVSVAIDPVRAILMATGAQEAMLHDALLLALIGAVFSFAAQSSSVAAALAVAAVQSGVLNLEAAVPLIGGANAAAIATNLLRVRDEAFAGRMIFTLQAVQKAFGTVFITAVALAATHSGGAAAILARAAGNGEGISIAMIFIGAQVSGALVATLAAVPLSAVFRRLAPPTVVEALGQPIFLMREALNDPAAALDLAVRELARLTLRLPLLLNHVRDLPDRGTPPVAVLQAGGASLAGAIKAYIATLLDHQPSRTEVANALLLDAAAGHALALHQEIADLAGAAPSAAALPTSGRMVEALHAMLTEVAEHAASLGADDPEIVLALLGHRDEIMEEVRMRLATDPDASSDAHSALFRMTMLFERVVWLARQLVVALGEAQRVTAEG